MQISGVIDYDPMKDKKKLDVSFWTKYKQFAGNEILLYVIMIVGIVLGIFIISFFVK